ncbi:MAG: hypothetical protein IIV23_02570, partial [Ruminococcus sp.]|nr:hypothetical protein [Ruminococcus sp.]
FAGGWTTVKLYFMIGLPTETMDDVAAIAQLGQDVVDTYYRTPNHAKGKSVRVTVSASSFVPKPFTPFQWEPQDTISQLHEKQEHIKKSITTKKVQFNYHDADTSFLEAVFARGDRKLCRVMALACERGFHFDGWNDCFSLENGWRCLRNAALTLPFMPTAAAALTRYCRGTISTTALKSAFCKRNAKRRMRIPQHRTAG